MDKEERKRLRRNDEHIAHLRGLLQDTTGLSNIPLMVEGIIDNAMWQDRVINDTGERIKFENFDEFVKAPPLAGLGMDIQTLYEICFGTQAQTKIEQSIPSLKPVGNTFRNGDISPLTKEGKNNRGTSRLYIVARLKRDIENANRSSNLVEAERLQSILDNVIGRQIPAIEAARQVGYKPRTALIYPSDISRTAKVLRKIFSDDELYYLVQLLADDET
jgi:hypothetical protein